MLSVRSSFPRTRRAVTLLGVAAGIVATAAFAASCADGGGGVIEPPPPDAPKVNLEITKTVNNATPTIGSSVTFTVTVRNFGPVEAPSVFAGDTLPTGLSYSTHSVTTGTYNSGTGLWTVGTLAVGGQATLTLVAQTQAGTAGTTLTNRAGVTSSAVIDSVLGNNIATAAVVPSAAPPPPVGVTFSSDWSTATGNSDAALRDGGRWNTAYCAQASTVLSVIPGNTVGWTKTANVLRLQQTGSSGCGTLERIDAVPLSTSHWGRLYFRNDEIGTQHNHVVTYNPGVGAPIQTAIWNRWGAPDGVNIFVRTYYTSAGVSMGYPTNVWSIGTPGVFGRDRLAHGTWYRYEWHMEYVTATTYRIWPRIYDMGGTLLYDATRFYQSDYPSSGSHSLATWYAAGNTFGFTDVTLGRRFGLGNEGPGGSTNTGGFWYHADVALSTAGWIGQ